MLNPSLIQRIRAIFLHPESRVTVAEAAELLGWSRRYMREAIRGREIEVIETCSGRMVEACEVVAKAVELWPLITIEQALGGDAGKVLPVALRCGKLSARLPRYLIATLAYLAEHGEGSVDACLARAVEDMASVHAEVLAASVPGFAEAFDWPHRYDARRVC